jgi:hypothetical protein
VNLEDIILSKISHIEKEKYFMFSFLYGTLKEKSRIHGNIDLNRGCQGGW